MPHKLINSTPQVGCSIPLKQNKKELLERLKKIELELFFYANIRRKEENELAFCDFLTLAFSN